MMSEEGQDKKERKLKLSPSMKQLLKELREAVRKLDEKTAEIQQLKDESSKDL